MKVIKIKNVKNRERILEDLIERVKKDDLNVGTWPLALDINLPDKESYIIIDNGEVISAFIKYEKGVEKASILWVDKIYRRKGYAKFLVNSLNIKYVTSLEESIPFWEKIGFTKISGNILKRIN